MGAVEPVMGMAPETIGSIGGFSALALVVGHMVGAYKAKLRTSSGDDARATPVLAQLLRDALNDLSQARTGEQIAIAQASTFGAKLEDALARIEEFGRRLSLSEQRNEHCDDERERLAARVAKLERERGRPPTPVEGMPAVTKEQTGGYRVRNPGG